MFLPELASNTAMLAAIKQAAEEDMPILAECGGLMYLCREIIDFAGKGYKMAGIIPAVCAMQQKLKTIGYIETTAVWDNILGNQN